MKQNRSKNFLIFIELTISFVKPLHGEEQLQHQIYSSIG